MVDSQETQSFEQWVPRVFGLLEHPSVKCEPRKFPIQISLLLSLGWSVRRVLNCILCSQLNPLYMLKVYPSSKPITEFL